MTGAGRPDDEADALVSAVLDGEATEAERERVEADPSLCARRDELAEVRRRVADVPPAPAEARTTAIAAALAAADGVEAPGAASAAGDPGDATVVDLSSRRAQRWQIAAVAAALLVLVGIVGVVLGGYDGTSTQEVADRGAVEADQDASSERFAEVGDAIASDGADRAEEAPAAESDAAAPEELDAPSTTSPLPAPSGGIARESGTVGDLGAFGDLDALARAVADVKFVAVEPSGSAPSCPPPAGGPLELTGDATLAGRAVAVVVLSGPEATRTLVVLDATSCAEIDRRPLP